MQPQEFDLPPQQISSGFSDLLYEFRDRTRTSTKVDEIDLKFRTSDIYFYTCEVGNKYLMMLAVYNRLHGSWRYFLKSGLPARNLVKHFCEKYGFEDAAKPFHERRLNEAHAT